MATVHWFTGIPATHRPSARHAANATLKAIFFFAQLASLVFLVAVDNVLAQHVTDGHPAEELATADARTTKSQLNPTVASSTRLERQRCI